MFTLIQSKSGSGVSADIVVVGDNSNNETKDKTQDSNEKKEQQQQQLARLLDTRNINTLPLNSPHNYSPYFGLEFDVTVQDYCRNQTNLINLNRCNQRLNEKEPQSKSGKKLKTKTNFSNSSTVSQSAVARSCKVVVSGDVAVGKTCLVNRFGHAVYSSTYRTTIGIDFDLQRFNILGQPYVLQIWDTAGLERFRCITSSYYRGCQAALIVFDMSNMSTLANVVKWRDEIVASAKTFDQLSSQQDSTNLSSNAKAHKGLQNDLPLLFLVGTKCDLVLAQSSRAFMTEQANKIASLIGAELWFVSAQTGENVDELFTRIAALSFNRCILAEVQRLKFDASTMGACLKEKIMQQQRELWSQSSKLIKITRKKDGDERRTRCVNVQCVIK